MESPRGFEIFITVEHLDEKRKVIKADHDNYTLKATSLEGVKRIVNGEIPSPSWFDDDDGEEVMVSPTIKTTLTEKIYTKEEHCCGLKEICGWWVRTISVKETRTTATGVPSTEWS